MAVVPVTPYLGRGDLSFIPMVRRQAEQMVVVALNITKETTNERNKSILENLRAS